MSDSETSEGTPASDTGVTDGMAMSKLYQLLKDAGAIELNALSHSTREIFQADVGSCEGCHES